jgi:hypothetical protein
VTARKFFLVVAAGHFLATAVFWAVSSVWQAELVLSAPADGTVVAPTLLIVISWIATLLALPFMLPLIYAANSLGYSPFHDNVYWIFPVLNSIAVALLIVGVRTLYVRRAVK